MIRVLSYIFLVLAPFFVADELWAKRNSCHNIKNKNFCVKIKFLQGISRKSDAKFELKLFDKNNRVVKLSSPPKIKLWMIMKNGHEHGSEELSIKLKNSDVLVENVWFLMRGEWQIKLNFDKGPIFSDIVPVCIGKNPKQSYLGRCLSSN